MPKQYGVSLPWNFPCKRTARGRLENTKRERVQAKDDSDDQEMSSRENFEEVSAQVKRDSYSLQISNLKKVFASGKVAIRNVSMTIYSGQIFALLGHNGAGKTTTISTLTGLLAPSQGRAILEGVDIFENQSYLRENLGVCPQHNVLFDYLTVREHLQLYATFKGVDAV